MTAGDRLSAWARSFAVVAAVLSLAPFAHAEGAAIVRPLGDAEVDWSAGQIRAHGGAAAELRLPSADMARPGAERRARAAALAKLRAALEGLPVGGHKLSAAALDAALGHARPVDVEYQSNGGVLLSMSVAFADLAPAGESPRPDGGAETAPVAPKSVLVVAAMPLEVAPRLAVGEHEAAPPYAVYRVGLPPSGVEIIAVRRDSAGRLILPKAYARALEKLAGVPAVIYVQKSPK